jgi:hypothetical protein
VVFALGDHLEVKVPDVEVEDDQALVVGVVLGVSGGGQVVKTCLPVDVFLGEGELVTELDLFEVLADGNVGYESIDIVL